jgi:hypothetical protein
LVDEDSFLVEGLDCEVGEEEREGFKRGVELIDEDKESAGEKEREGNDKESDTELDEEIEVEGSDNFSNSN